MSYDETLALAAQIRAQADACRGSDPEMAKLLYEVATIAEIFVLTGEGE